MKLISLFLYRIASIRSLVFFIVLYILFPAYFLINAENKINELAGKEIGVIDLSFGFAPQRTLEMVAKYGEEARNYYAQVEMTVDLVYPIVYALLFGIILSLLFANSSLKGLNILPFVTMLFDFLENSHIIILLHSYPQQSYSIAIFCEIFKLLKWLSLGLFMLVIIYGLILKLKKQQN